MIFLKNQILTKTYTTAKLVLRDYQKECILESLRCWDQMCVSLPVGSGKTVIFSNLIKLLKDPKKGASKILVIAHRDELLKQAFEKVKVSNPDFRICFDQSTQKADIENNDVIIASVATLGRKGTPRLSKYDLDLFKCIIIDEAHHAAADQYKRVLSHFRSDKHYDDSHILVWGCSATLRRHDGLALNVAFDEIVYEKTFKEMLDQGYLCDFKLLSITTKTDLDKLMIQKKEFVIGSLSKFVNTPERNSLIVSTYRVVNETPESLMNWKSNNGVKYEHRKLKSTLVFATDVKHIEDLTQTFLQMGILARGISAKTSDSERRQILAQFSNGTLPVLINCGILTEGVDVPRIDSIFLARPTKSLGLLQQMLGRGLRKHIEKECCTIVDFVDLMQYNRRGLLANPATLLGLPEEYQEQTNSNDGERQVTPSGIIPASIMTENIHFRAFTSDYLTALEEDCHLLNSWSPFSWVRVGEYDFCLNLPDNSSILILQEGSIWRSYEHKKKSYTNLNKQGKNYIQSKKLVGEHDMLDHAIKSFDNWCRKKFGSLAKYCLRSAEWRKLPASEAQIKYVKKGARLVDADGKVLTKGVASDMISRISHGASKKAKKKEREIEGEVQVLNALKRQVESLRPTLDGK